MPLRLAIVCAIILLTFGVLYRRRNGLALDFDYLLRLSLISLGLGSATGFTFIPSLWMAISFALLGGKLDDHLISDANTIAYGVVVSVLLGALWAIKSYVDHLRA